MRLQVTAQSVIAPLCRKCRRLMCYHSTEEVDLGAAAQSRTMIVFRCAPCEKWHAVPLDMPGQEAITSAA